MPLTDQEIQQLEAEVRKLPDLKSQLDAAVKRADQAAGQWGQGPELRIKALEGDLKSALEARAELEKRFNARADEIETRMNRGNLGGGRDEKSVQHAEAMKAFGTWLRKGIVPTDSKALVTNDGPGGGYLMPAPLVGRMIEELVQISPIRANSTPLPITEGDALDLPRDEGSFTASWVGETQTRAATTTPAFAKIRVTLREQQANPQVTQKMLDDSGFDVEGYVARKLAQRFAYAEGVSFLTGDNVLAPHGALNSDSGIATTSTGGAGVITTDGLMNIMQEVPTEYAARASLFMTRKTKFALRKLKDTVNGRYLWEPGLPQGSATPGSGLTQAHPDTFAGVPIVETPGMPELASGSRSILFGDWRQFYQIVDKPTVAMLRDPFSNKPYVGFYTTRRVGGEVILPTAARIGVAT